MAHTRLTSWLRLAGAVAFFAFYCDMSSPALAIEPPSPACTASLQAEIAIVEEWLQLNGSSGANIWAGSDAGNPACHVNILINFAGQGLDVKTWGRIWELPELRRVDFRDLTYEVSLPQTLPSNLRQLNIYHMRQPLSKNPKPLRLPLPNLHEGLVGLQLEGAFQGGVIPALPSTLQGLTINGGVTGQIPPLPPGLGYLNLADNQLSGPLPNLPSSLRNLYVSNNQLSGTISSFPNLRDVILSNNRFSGRLPQLPPNVEYFRVDHNEFSGFIPSQFPTTLTILNLSYNRLCPTNGIFDPTQLCDLAWCAPKILSNPASVTVPAGQPATLSVRATTEAPWIAYEWFEGQTGDVSRKVAGATAPEITFTPRGTAYYWARAYNGCNYASSAAAKVDVSACPSIKFLAQPTSTSIRQGESTVLGVYASSTSALTYQWYRTTASGASVIVDGARANYLTVAPNESTSYYVKVSSSCRDAFSQPATVTVRPANVYYASFRTYYGLYISALNGGGSTVNAGSYAFGDWEKFKITDLNGGDLYSGDLVTIQAANGMYLSAEWGGGSNVTATRTVAGPWEQFVIADSGGSAYLGASGGIVLQSALGYYVVAEGGGGGEVNCNRQEAHEWETFGFDLH